MTTRRDFLKQAGILTAGALISGNSLGFNLLKKPDVIILGAGFSGLAAGRLLNDNGANVTILEARNRLGGRIFSHEIDKADNIVIELGGEWIGRSHERMIEICKELGLELINNEFDDRLVYEDKFYTPEEWDFTPEWKVKWDKIIADYKNFTEDDKKQLDKMDWWRFLMNNDIPARDLDLREYADSTDFGESIRFVSAYAALAEYAESNENNEMDLKVKGGNGLIAKAMADKIGLDKILLDHKVVSVDQSGSKIKITCENGQTFECDKLICSLPTFSISKINWNPALPQIKIDAINALQYSRINKTATLFKERFWTDQRFSILTDTLTHYFYHATKFQNGNKGVLISYSIGDKADMMSRLTKDEREHELARSLNIAFGDVKPLIETTENYYWGTDQYSKGAYALYGKGQWFVERPILGEKFNNIYFSGEHVADWQGFMEGAVNTGEEAAKEILS